MISPILHVGLLFVATLNFAPSSEWSPEVFDYDRPARFEVQDTPDPGKLRLPGITQQYLTFKDVRGQDVPVLIAMPKGRGPFPAIVLVHGYTSTKEQVTSLVAARLLQRGFATVALDLPMHGARPGPPEGLFADPDTSKVYERLVQAVVDVRQVIDLVESRKDLDTSKGVSLVGYSMGGWLAALAGGADRRVSAMILMVPVSEARPPDTKTPKSSKDEPKPLLEAYPVLRPTGAIAHFGPRPVLIQAGKLDGYLRKSAVDALLAAARQPKEVRWYSCGHILNDKALAEAAEWLVERIRSTAGGAKAAGDGKPAAGSRQEGAKEQKQDGAKRK